MKEGSEVLRRSGDKEFVSMHPIVLFWEEHAQKNLMNQKQFLSIIACLLVTGLTRESCLQILSTS